MSFGQEKAVKFDDKHFEVLFFSKCSFFLAVALHVLAVSLSKASKKFFH